MSSSFSEITLILEFLLLPFQKFLKIFDIDGDKTITREEYMEALGFVPNPEPQ